MNWLNSLFFGVNTAHDLFVISLVITIGVILGRIKIFGISFGVTWILFMGILAGHFSFTVGNNILSFMRDFGLVLFVYSIGLQVGPSFFSSLKKAGIKLNIIAMSVVFLGALTALAIHYIEGVPIPTMVGILYGAVTNTPGLGAAQQTFSDITGTSDQSIALGYAVAYPMGVIGVIASMILIKSVFKIKNDTELANVTRLSDNNIMAKRFTVRISNPAIEGKNVDELHSISKCDFVISRYYRDGKIELPTHDTIFRKNDLLRIVANAKDRPFIVALFGEEATLDWQKIDAGFESRRIFITNPKANGKTLSKLGLAGGISFNVTRITRASIDLVARPDLVLQLGDRITVVGIQSAIKNTENILGNSTQNLRKPNLLPIFFGIVLGILLGSIPFSIPAVPQSVKLGLAGGPLVVAILLGRFGPNLKIATYTTTGANLMLREIGIAVFLASVGIGAGRDFVSTIVNEGGYMWIVYGAIITLLPLLIVGIVARIFVKLDFFSIMGVLAGSTTNPPALAFANTSASNDMPSVSYATVYPLTMFMRVLVAQLLIIFFI